MSEIQTTAPISIDLLKKYFEDNTTTYMIDYNESSIKGLKLLIYLNNLDIPVNISIDIESDEFQELLLEYFKCPYLINIEVLEIAAMYIVFARKGLYEESDLSRKFINNNSEVVDKWINMLDSLTLFNMWMMSNEVPEFKEFVESFPEDNTNNFGVNFVNLLKYDMFYDYFQTVSKDNSDLRNYKVYFNEYVFKGQNLFHYWSTEKNPLFLLTWAIGEGVAQEELEKLIAAAQ